jgi:hypothetical protein
MLKIPGTLYQRSTDGYITNLYNVEFINKTFETISLEAKIESPTAASLERADGKDLIIPGEGMVKGIFFIRIPEKEVTNARTIVRIGIYQQGKRIETLKVKFIGPVSQSSDLKR